MQSFHVSCQSVTVIVKWKFCDSVVKLMEDNLKNSVNCLQSSTNTMVIASNSRSGVFVVMQCCRTKLKNTRNVNKKIVSGHIP